MAQLPQYYRKITEVGTEFAPQPRKVDKFYQPAPYDYSREDRRIERQEKISDYQGAANLVNAIGDTALKFAGAINQELDRKAVVMANEALTGADLKLKDFYRNLQRDANYEDFQERYEDFQQEIYNTQAEDLDARSAEMFSQKYTQLNAKYADMINQLQYEKETAHIQASLTWQIDEAQKAHDSDRIYEILFGSVPETQEASPEASKNIAAFDIAAAYDGQYEVIAATDKGWRLKDPETEGPGFFVTPEVALNSGKITEKQYAEMAPKDQQRSGEGTIPGAVGMGLMREDQAMQIYEQAIYTINTEELAAQIKGAAEREGYGAAIQSLMATADGEYELAPWLKGEDREALIDGLVSEKNYWTTVTNNNKKQFDEQAANYHEMEYRNGRLTWSMLQDRANAYYDLDFRSGKNDFKAAINPSDALSIMELMQADAAAAEKAQGSGYAAALSDQHDMNFNHLEAIINNQEVPHLLMDAKIKQWRAENYISAEGMSDLIRFNEQRNPDPVYTGYIKDISADEHLSNTEKGRVEEDFKTYYKNTYFLDAASGKVNPDRPSDEEYQMYLTKLKVPYLVEELSETISPGSTSPYSNENLSRGEIRNFGKMRESNQTFTLFEQALSHGFLFGMDANEKALYQPWINLAKDRQTDWFTDIAGKRQYPAVGELEQVHMVDDVLPVFEDENGALWSYVSTGKKEILMSYSDTPVQDGLLRMGATDGTPYVYLDGLWLTYAQLKERGQLKESSVYIMGQNVKNYQVKSRISGTWIPTKN